jgi:1-phosphofructokinase family hexose kinase
MKSYILTITLNPAVDKTVKVSNFKIGKDFREESIFVSAGGKGINIARVLKYLDLPSIASGFLGGTNGAYIKQQLDKEGIKNDFCLIKGNTRTSLTIIDPSSNTITRVLERGPQITKKEQARFKRKFLNLLKICSYVIFSGRNIPGAPDSFYNELIKIAKRRDAVTVFDTSGKAFELGLRAKPFMIKPNLKEAEQVIGRELNSLLKIKEAVYYFHKYGIKIVTITMGSKGAIAFNGTQMLLAIPPRVKRKSPVGCGDAFIGGFITSLVRNKSFSECVKMAVACGAANALSINPGFIKPRVLKRILTRIKIRKINHL